MRNHPSEVATDRRRFLTIAASAASTARILGANVRIRVGVIVQNFLDCIRSRKTPNPTIAAGIACARAGHLGNMALRQGRQITT